MGGECLPPLAVLAVATALWRPLRAVRVVLLVWLAVQAAWPLVGRFVPLVLVVRLFGVGRPDLLLPLFVRGGRTLL